MTLLVSQIVQWITSNSPRFFEHLVLDLMLAMGYGGSRTDAGRSVGWAGDEGIDGIMKQDRLGLELAYVQAKRWEGTVGRPEVQEFVGTLHGKHAKKRIDSHYIAEEWPRPTDEKSLLGTASPFWVSVRGLHPLRG